MRLTHRLRERDGRLARGIRELAPDQIDPGVGVRAAAPDRFLQAAADRTVGVGAGDQDEIGVEPPAGVDRGAELPDRLLAREDRLAGDVAASFREPLVLDVDAGHAGLDVLLHRSDRAEGIAVAVVRVGDDRERRGAGDHGREARHLRHRDEAHVRPAVGQRDRVTAHVDGLQPDARGDLGVER